MWFIRNKWKQQNAQLLNQLAESSRAYTELLNENSILSRKLTEYEMKYPFEIGQVVYDVQLRSSKGRFTKTKAAREYSLINEVVVDKKNYFNLVDRYASKDVFTDLNKAEQYLDTICVE